MSLPTPEVTAVQTDHSRGPESVLDSRFLSERVEAVARPFSWLLGKEPFRRVLVFRTLASIFVFVLCVLLIAQGINTGWIDPLAGTTLAGLILTSCLGFYLAIRTGWSERFRDPALTLTQVLVAETWIAVAYSITGQAHGATLILYALVMFFGVFNMDVKSAKISGGYVLLMTSISMLYKSYTDPFHYPANIEFVHYIFVVVSVPVMAYLGGQIAGMRNRLKAQKAELTAAFERIQEMAMRDELTGLINRRHGLEVLQEYKTLLKRNKLDVWVTLIDLDYFKRINDTWGHGVGDEVLKGFAVQAKKSLRSADVVVRWGGEEFLVIMLEEPEANPSIGIDRFRDSLSQYRVSPTVPDLRIAFSAGLARCRHDESIEASIDRADQALYQAKHEGRNRSVMA